MQTNLQDSARKLGLAQRYTFQEDNHTAEIFKNCQKKNKINRAVWSSQFTNLNLPDFIDHQKKSPKNDLKREFSEAWDKHES